MAITKPSAKIILDSISPSGHRLTTMEVVMHRFVLAEFNTHRAFSRNSASSRAIPIEKRIKDVLENPAIPLEWGSNKPGMQAGEELPTDVAANCESIWLESRNKIVSMVSLLEAHGLHKQVANRLLEPFLWHKALVSSTEWENFFVQRASPHCGYCFSTGEMETQSGIPCPTCNGTGKLKSLAQPEMVALADAMREALNNSKPVERCFHLPYVMLQPDKVVYMTDYTLDQLKEVSVGFCASTSTYNHDGSHLRYTDAVLIHNKLRSATPPHMSPFEHVAVADEENVNRDELGNETWQKGNFTGWKQYRYEVFGR